MITTQFSHEWSTNIQRFLSGNALRKRVGDKLPTYPNLFKVSDAQETTLAHREGEVLLINLWATWCGSCQEPMGHNQKMLEQNEEAWKDKVRIVAVSADDEI